MGRECNDQNPNVSDPKRILEHFVEHSLELGRVGVCCGAGPKIERKFLLDQSCAAPQENKMIRFKQSTWVVWDINTRARAHPPRLSICLSSSSWADPAVEEQLTTGVNSFLTNPYKNV